MRVIWVRNDEPHAIVGLIQCNSYLLEDELILQRGVSVIATTGLQFDLTTPQGKLIASVMASLAEFERDLVRERVYSGLAAAKAKGKKLGRKPGQRVKADKYAPKVLQMVADGLSYRQIAQELHLSKTTVNEIVKRHRLSNVNSSQIMHPSCPPKQQSIN